MWEIWTKTRALDEEFAAQEVLGLQDEERTWARRGTSSQYDLGDGAPSVEGTVLEDVARAVRRAFPEEIGAAPLHVVQCIRQSAGDRGERGFHQDPFTNGGHIIVGVTLGPARREIAMLMGEKRARWSQAAGDGYVMSGVSRYGEGLTLCKHAVRVLTASEAAERRAEVADDRRLADRRARAAVRRRRRRESTLAAAKDEAVGAEAAARRAEEAERRRNAARARQLARLGSTEGCRLAGAAASRPGHEADAAAREPVGPTLRRRRARGRTRSPERRRPMAATTVDGRRMAEAPAKAEEEAGPEDPFKWVVWMRDKLSAAVKEEPQVAAEAEAGVHTAGHAEEEEEEEADPEGWRAWVNRMRNKLSPAPKEQRSVAVEADAAAQVTAPADADEGPEDPRKWIAWMRNKNEKSAAAAKERSVAVEADAAAQVTAPADADEGPEDPGEWIAWMRNKKSAAAAKERSVAVEADAAAQVTSPADADVEPEDTDAWGKRGRDKLSAAEEVEEALERNDPKTARPAELSKPCWNCHYARGFDTVQCRHILGHTALPWDKDARGFSPVKAPGRGDGADDESDWGSDAEDEDFSYAVVLRFGNALPQNKLM
jgi:hypothetical protein